MIQKGEESEDEKQPVMQGVMERASRAEKQHVQRPRGGETLFLRM